MDQAVKARKPHRSFLTKTVNELQAAIAVQEPDLGQILDLLEKLEDVWRKLSEHDQKLLDFIVVTHSEEDYEKECESIEEYHSKFRITRSKVNRMLQEVQRPVNATVSVSTSPAQPQKMYRLPKIELKKFNGDLKEWLPFWAQFQRIHEDRGVSDADKFQYLVQCMVKDSRAYEVVASYPQTSENYNKVIEALKSRFGKEDLLMEVYVRELQQLVISNASSRETLSIAKIYDQLESHLRALESLGVNSDKNATLLYPMIESSLAGDVLKAWQRDPLSRCDGTKENPPKNRLDLLMEFLKKEVENEERFNLAKSSVASPSKEKKKDKANKAFRDKDDLPTTAGLFAGQGMCLFCEKSGHDSQACFKGQTMSLAEKRTKLQTKKACFNCLRIGHLSKDCKGLYIQCMICGRKHVTLMCLEAKGIKKPDEEKKESKIEKVTTTSAYLNCSKEIILQTVILYIKSKGRKKKVRLLFDNGSQRSYVLQKTAKSLNLEPRSEIELCQMLFGGSSGYKTHKTYQIELESLHGKYSYALDVIDEKQICGPIPRVSAGPWMKGLKQNKIWQTDVGNDCPEIEVLIGADHYQQLQTGKRLQLPNGLWAVETYFGWALSGKESGQSNTSVAMTVTTMFVKEASISELWKLEAIGINYPVESKSKQEKDDAARNNFIKTIKRSDDGRYSVRLPWIDGQQKIPDNLQIAEKRLESETRKLNASGMYDEYEKIFTSWMEEGIIEDVTSMDQNGPCHFLPHRPVFKPESITTPIRPVFDASCKKDRSPSLNDCLEKGPNLLELIPSILLRFREGKIGVISDIRKAFLMISIQEADRDYLRFLWWEDIRKKNYKVFRHNRVVFGVNCSPFLLGAVIEMHLNAVEEDQKPIADKLLKSLYVDNCVTSVNTIEEYEEFKFQATQIMASAKMELRLWQRSSGDDSGTGSLDSRECRLGSGRTAAQSDITTVLGLNWDTYEDTLSCDLEFDSEPNSYTRREVLSFVQKIYDPLGFLSPALLHPKKILQETWDEKTGWDDVMNDDQRTRFETWCREIHHLKMIGIPRNSNGNNVSRETWEIHTFCDASRDGYAAVIFLRCGKNQEISVQLLQAKSRVAPLKKVTIPRLELLACTIAARLTDTVKKAFGLEDWIRTFFWSDSTTALAWIKRNDDWGTFVGNRVKEILSLTSAEDWRHIAGVQNPADLPSRGCIPSKLVESRWWEGPTWLRKSQDQWPTVIQEVDEDEILQERKKCATAVMACSDGDAPWYLIKSSFYENVRIVAWLRRFVSFVGKKKTESGYLKLPELVTAEKVLMKLVQGETLQVKNENVAGLRVCRDEEGVIRVKTKLLNRNDTASFKYPILLPHSHPLVNQLIKSTHRVHGHAGVQFIMSKLREKYWVIQGRRAVRSVVKKCVICRRFSMKKSEVVPAPLPLDRVKRAAVFEVVGVDMAGPLQVKKGGKVWILIVICAVYRCVHLEIVESLSTEAFREAFTKFTDLRGRRSVVYSDNGTNFVGAWNALQRIDWEKVTRLCGLRSMDWRFNPPSAAWWGGWWERLIRTMKDLLKRILRNSKVTKQKLQHYLSGVAAVMNERPLTTVSEDPDDLIALTPAMFMNEIPVTTEKDIDFLDSRDYQNLYRERRNILDDFKQRFRKEYLSQLVQRKKGKPMAELRVGDIVLIGDDNKRRWQWPLARVMEVMRGKDGHVRVYRLKTASGILVRAAQRLFPLEVSSPAELPQSIRPEVEDHKEDESESSSDVNNQSEVVTRFGRKVNTPDRYGSNK